MRFHGAFIVLAAALFQLWSCAGKTVQSLLPEGIPVEGSIQLESEALRVVFTDNRAYGDVHLARFNGIALLTHQGQDSTVFVPQYAGFNLEHIFGGDSLVPLFEPRDHLMQLFRSADNQVQLYQSTTPVSGVEVLTTFTLTGANYIDIEVNCLLHNPGFFKHGYAGLFWASYINAPQDPKIYFMGTETSRPEPHWIGAWSGEHGIESTHRSLSDDHELYFAPNFNATLANHYSTYHFSDPYYYGLFHQMVLAFLFQPDQQIRFSQSPTGGSLNFTLKPVPDQLTNPAWDFQWIIPDPQANRVYTLKSRLLYKPFMGPEDISREYQSWSPGISENK